MRFILKTALTAITLGIAGAPAVIAQTDDAFVGEVRPMPFTFCPRGWSETDGRLIAISSNSALYSLIGTQFGGDGVTSFALPDLRGRTAVGIGQAPGSPYQYQQGEMFGVENVTLTTAELPMHSHQIQATAADPDTGSLNGHGWAEFPAGAPADTYNTGGSLNEVARTGTIGNAGGNLPHYNMAPTQVVRYCIALTGIYPSRP